MAVFADPDGAAFCVWQAKEHLGATVVNEHGSLNFNDLNTGDLDGAQGVLRRCVRLGARSTLGGGSDVGAARLRRLPRAAHPGHA